MQSPSTFLANTLEPAPMLVALKTTEPPETPVTCTAPSVVTSPASSALTVLTWFRAR